MKHSRLTAAAACLTAFHGCPASSSMQNEVWSDEDALQTTAAPAAEPRSVSYPPEFFERYQPLNALDMVQRLPGFRLQDGDGSRGFAGAAGNLLINERRPTAKHDSPEDILSRIPASHVARIELIRASGAGVDMGRYSALANVVLKDDVPASVTWEAFTRRNPDHGAVVPGGTFSLSDSWGPVQYTAGVFSRKFAYGQLGPELLFDAAGSLIEERFDRSDASGVEVIGSFNAAGWIGDALLQVNTQYATDRRQDFRRSHRQSHPSGAARDLLFGYEPDEARLEVGADLERSFGADLIGKAIVLFGRTDRSVREHRRTLDAAGESIHFRRAVSDRETSERIARAELSWSGWPNHVIQANMELAGNTLDNRVLASVDAGDGLATAPVPGANGLVEESRANFAVNDTWVSGGLTVDMGVGAEASQISQRGDAHLDRSFFFLKPSSTVAFAPDDDSEARLRVAREVSQLNFERFVSATDFEDNDLAMGNPQLRPETLWLAELSFERRWGDVGMVMLKGFHNWIADVEDLKPLGPFDEAPGNLGDGRRWGAEVNATLPLYALSLDGARLDVAARWQNSCVMDPVTGRERVLSDEREYDVTFDYRQDFDVERFAWGWRVRLLAERPMYKVNELDVHDAGAHLNVFIETARWLGMKIRMTIDNVLDRTISRERTRYAGERGLSSMLARETRERVDGPIVTLAFSGAF